MKDEEERWEDGHRGKMTVGRGQGWKNGRGSGESEENGFVSEKQTKKQHKARKT